MINWLKLLFHAHQYTIIKEREIVQKYVRRSDNDSYTRDEIEYHCACKHCGKMKFYTSKVI